MVVPERPTLAKGTGLPAEVTFPDIAAVWAGAVNAANSSMMVRSKRRRVFIEV
jgi:hypothetical protein